MNDFRDSLSQYLNAFTCGDSLEVLKTLPDGCVPLVVTSPPYNLRNTTGSSAGRTAGGKWSTKLGEEGYADFDDNLPRGEYITQQRLFLNQAMRILQGDGAIFYNHKYRVQGGLLDILPDEITAGFPVIQRIIWQRHGGINFNDRYFLPTYEIIYLIGKPDFRLVKKASGLTDVWKVGQERNNPHPAPFPVEIAERCIKSTSARMVVDPYSGSGSTAIAARRLGRFFIGIDSSTEYCDMARDRLQAEYESRPFLKFFLSIREKVW